MSAEIDPLEEATIGLCSQIKMDVRTFSTLSDAELWHEVTACILGSQVSFRLANEATKALAAANLLGWQRRDLVDYESRLASCLRQPLLVEGRIVRYRFPASRARQIAHAHSVIHLRCGGLRNWLMDGEDDALRIQMMDGLPGLGPKQATLFLRNVGLTSRLAILDSHVLKFMRALDMIRVIPRALDVTRYFSLESVLQKYAQQVGYPLAHLDRAIWAVMKADAEGLE